MLEDMGMLKIDIGTIKYLMGDCVGYYMPSKQNDASAYIFLTLKAKDGEIRTTLTQLAADMGWSVGRVKRYLRRLELCDIITTAKVGRKTIIRLEKADGN